MRQKSNSTPAPMRVGIAPPSLSRARETTENKVNAATGLSSRGRTPPIASEGFTRFP